MNRKVAITLRLFEISSLKHRLMLTLSFLFIFCITNAQQLTQTIHGKVYDSFTGTTLPGVNIIVTQDSIKNGAVTDIDGYFLMENLPIGKYTLTASYVGYKTYVQDNLYLLSGRSQNVEIRLTEAVMEIGEAVVYAIEKKDESLNKMALIGARSFTVEETNRYAGSYGDPARMAMNYAGVLPVRDNRNDIIIRGNSATGLQYRVNGIVIPNPNHFGATGTTGGPITILNSNFLSKSDFFNGAFPAEYGDAVAGVFDIKLKSGNTLEHEKWIQIGWNGLELGMEGPLKKEKFYTYMVSYRHGLTNLSYLVGFKPKNWIYYKDLSFRFNFPMTKTGTWSIIGMGGSSRIIMDESNLSEKDRTFATYGEDLDNSTAMGVVGITNRIYAGDKAKIESIISATGNTVDNLIDTFNVANMEPFKWGVEDTKEIKFTAKSKVNYKVSKTVNLTFGAVYDHFILSFYDLDYHHNAYQVYTDTANAQMGVSQAFIGCKKQIGSRFEGYLGVHGQMLHLNNSSAIEPRLGLKYVLNEKGDISYGFGLHSQALPKVVYYVQSIDSVGAVSYSNADLDLTKSMHHTLGYNLLFNENLRLKVELYYQYLYDVPVHQTLTEYSLINFGTEYYVSRQDSLVNKGKGENYGVEITFEQFFTKKFFYLFTASIFESNYTGVDNLKRNTAFNGKYAFNLLGGYEKTFPKKNVTMILGINLTYAGGSPYVPFDQAETVELSRVSYDWGNAYEAYRKEYRRISIRTGIKRNLKKTSIETSLDLQYRGDYTSIYKERIDVTTGNIITTEKMGFYPMINTRISF